MNQYLSPKYVSLTAACLLAAACTTSTDDPVILPADDGEVAAVEAALEQENGGFTTDDEAVGFGDPLVMATPDLVDHYADSTDLTPPPDAPPDLLKLRVLLVWGNLPNLPSTEPAVPPAANPVDWTGSISLDQGAIRVNRTLLFDGQDGVAPREDVSEVSFKSTTLPHVDGLLIELLALAGSTLHFDTTALTTDIDLDALAANSHGTVLLDDDWNGLAAAAYVPDAACTEGFVFGHWKNLKTGLGVFRGRVALGEGEGIGFVKGIYGHAKKLDKDVFFGKYIESSGAFGGLLGGSYGSGSLEGGWATHEAGNTGLIRGRYFSGYSQGDGPGFLAARWRDKCDG